MDFPQTFGYIFYYFFCYFYNKIFVRVNFPFKDHPHTTVISSSQITKIYLSSVKSTANCYLDLRQAYKLYAYRCMLFIFSQSIGTSKATVLKMVVLQQCRIERGREVCFVLSFQLYFTHKKFSLLKVLSFILLVLFCLPTVANCILRSILYLFLQ